MKKLSEIFRFPEAQLNELEAYIREQVAEQVAAELARLNLTQKPESPSLNRLVDYHELRTIVDIGETKLWQLRRDGVIKAVKVGRKVLYNPQEVLKALTEAGYTE